MIRTFENQSPQIAENVYIDQSAVIIGQVFLEEGSSVWPMTVLRGDVNAITIGRKSNLQDGVVIHVNHPSSFNQKGDDVVVGNQVTIGHRVLLHGCCIEGRSLIGMGSCLMDRVVVESGVLVAAGSLVTPGTILKSGYLWMGRPARQIRKLAQEELDRIDYSAEYYFQLAQRYQHGNI